MQARPQRSRVCEGGRGSNIIITGERALGALHSLYLMSTNTHISDVEVLQKSQSRPWMFGILVDRYQKAFLRKGVKILHSKEAAEDAVQETFLKIYKYAGSFSEKENASFSSWGYKILVNTCTTIASKKAGEMAKVEAMDFSDLDKASFVSEYENIERVSYVGSILRLLPNKFSRLLHLYFFEEKSYEEIALSENISVSSVRSGIHRAKKQLKGLILKIS